MVESYQNPSVEVINIQTKHTKDIIKAYITKFHLMFWRGVNHITMNICHGDICFQPVHTQIFRPLIEMGFRFARTII